ncbi:MAG TPA: Gfo/Idh/MocA family oxidoreductase [Candidatus Limnocylindrales bacterium]|nr:Gfo/Idh/MocA family oxidoreductase [Candidatus Limnocylindrales bacterium]
MSPARIGVIGCGWWATRAHLPALEANPDAVIAAIADTDPGNRTRTAERFGVPPSRIYDSAESMLDAGVLDAAIIAVPHAAHAGIARLVLERGIHLLLEKPMTIRPADARALAALAVERGVELIVGYPWHYNRQVLAIRDAIADGRIGTIEYVSCLFASIVRELYRGNPEPYRDVLGYTLNPPGERTYADPEIAGGGQGQTQVTHSAALLLFMTGLEPVTVSALTEAYELQVDLADALAVRFRGGAIGSLASTGSVLPGQDEILEYRIFGDQGHIDFDVNEGLAVIHGRDGEVHRLPGLAVEERYPDWAPADNLVDVVLGRAGNGSPAALGVMTVELVDALYRSAREGRSLAVGAEEGVA